MKLVDLDEMKTPMPNDYPEFDEMLAYIDELKDADEFKIVFCINCEKCKEIGGHTNCDGYLYCKRKKSVVDEYDYCSWGVERL